MKLIVGLGNPGPKYSQTRHNTGRKIAESLVGEVESGHFYEPVGFYNTVGTEIADQLRFYKLTPQDLLIIHDELDLPFGEMRLQLGKASAGNHGVESIIAALNTNDFWRLRVGIGSRGDVPGDQYVIDRYSKVEENRLQQEIIPAAKELVKDWLKNA